MTDTLRDRIADVLLAHAENDAGPDCTCGWEWEGYGLWKDSYASHVADAILALPGIAVVELPKSDYDGDDGDGGVGWGTGDNSVFTSGGMVYDQYSEFSSAEAREIGLWWIAAAEHAEKETK